MWILALSLLHAALAADPGYPRFFPPTSRVVGGTQASEGAWPWQVSLQVRYLFSYSHICGGSLITNRWVLTAAHCVDGQSASSMRIYAGMTSLSGNNEYRTVSRVIMHPQYGPQAGGYPNDIALLELTSAFTLTNNINVVPLPTERDVDFTGIEDCYITGWGKTSGSNSGGSTVLMEAQMPNIGVSECRSRWAGISGATVHDHHICPFVEGKSACSGDSGGPYVCRVDGTYVLAGVTSWGISTCSGEYPSVYVRTSHFLDWISNYVS